MIGPTAQRLVLSDDWSPLGFSTNASVTGGLVFVGFGIKAAELDHDDYQGLPVSENIARAGGTPDGENAQGPLFPRNTDVHLKAIADTKRVQRRCF